MADSLRWLPWPGPVPMRSDARGLGWLGDAAIGALNGAVGDRLDALDMGMSLRCGPGYLPVNDPGALGRALAEGGARDRLAVFVHGLAATEWSWCLESAAYHGDPAASFGTLLQRDLGHLPVFVRYNSGRRIADNGALLAEELERMAEAWPGELEEIVLVGHSMGGLVLRMAAHQARRRGMKWPARVRQVFCIGSPHHGVPLEKLVHLATRVLGAIDTPGTRIAAAILGARSAGIRDLGWGTEVPLLDGAVHCFLAATVTQKPGHPMGWLVGDLMVRMPSASGVRLRHRRLRIETHHFGGLRHHQLQNHPAVYEQIRRSLTDTGRAFG